MPHVNVLFQNLIIFRTYFVLLFYIMCVIKNAFAVENQGLSKPYLTIVALEIIPIYISYPYALDHSY